MPAKPTTKESLLLRLASLCARSEQCESDIVRKIYSKGLGSSDVDWILQNLRERAFVDDARFARSFARDKVRFSAWGRRKIRAALIAKRISEATIGDAFEQIDPDDYADALARAARAKAANLDLAERDDRVKLFRHLVSRGFESDIAMAEIKQLCRR